VLEDGGVIALGIDGRRGPKPKKCCYCNGQKNRRFCHDATSLYFIRLCLETQPDIIRMGEQENKLTLHSRASKSTAPSRARASDQVANLQTVMASMTLN
jgi:hypothetical protein